MGGKREESGMGGRRRDDDYGNGRTEWEEIEKGERRRIRKIKEEIWEKRKERRNRGDKREK